LIRILRQGKQTEQVLLDPRFFWPASV